jgi:high-affinity nickel-transport protein
VIVAATAAAVRDRFDKYSQIGGIIGSSVSAGFLIILGMMNVFILYKLVGQLRAYLKSINPGQESLERLELVGGGFFLGLMQKTFRMIDR